MTNLETKLVDLAVAKSMSRLGISHLEEAVLLVLLQARRDRKHLGAKYIAEVLDIPTVSPHKNALVSGVLYALLEKKKVKKTKQQHKNYVQLINKAGWQLTPEEFRARKREK